MPTANYPIVLGDVLTAGQESFTIEFVFDDGDIGVVGQKLYRLPASIVQAIGTVDPKTGTPRV